ncbi:MAG: iron-containing alcohol dehydrogenase, partial [Lachnospiraceae bacterium]
MKQFKIKTEVLFSENAMDWLLTLKDRHVVLITDAFMVSSGAADMIVKKLVNCKSVSVFSEVVPDPPLDLVTKGVGFLVQKQADTIVALGGGSSIDAAKAIAYMAYKA